MKNLSRLKPFAVFVPLALASCNQPSAVPPQVACNVGGTQGFKVTLSVENDGSGNPVVKFTNYTLDVAPNGGAARSPLIFVCVGGQATFDNINNDERIRFTNDPGGVFTPSNQPNPHADSVYIIHNSNTVAGMFHYSITVDTKDFGVMTLDPRVKNTGGGTQAISE